MKQVLVFGGSSAVRVVKDYLLKEAASYHWQVNVIEEPITDEVARKELIRNADLVISLDPAHHQRIAEDCIAFGTHLITPAPINEKIMNLRSRMESSNVLFLYEMGFNPGLDHMKSMHSIESIRAQGGDIIGLHSHSGRLVAPEHDDNPWHFKTNDPQLLIHEGREGAVYKEKGTIARLNYKEIFDGSRLVEFPGLGFLGWYPVADSMGYIPLYGLTGAETFVRTTLRHPDFLYGWKNIVELHLTDDSRVYDSDGRSLADFFRIHFDRHGFSGWLEKKMMDRFTQTKEILEKLMQFMEVEEEAREGSKEYPGNILMVDDKGKLENIDLEDVKDKAAAIVAYKMHEANLTLKQLFFLGMDDQETLINKGNCSAADVLSLALKHKMAIGPQEHDMAVMMHEVEYIQKSQHTMLTSSLMIKGNSDHYATDTITGLILGIAAKLVLTAQVNLKGLHIPISSEIYEPILNELRINGIVFEEQRRLI